jgi:hypothetical protein
MFCRAANPTSEPAMPPPIKKHSPIFWIALVAFTSHADYAFPQGEISPMVGRLYCDAGQSLSQNDIVAVRNFCAEFAASLDVMIFDGAARAGDLFSLSPADPVFELSIDRTSHSDLRVGFAAGDLALWENGDQAQMTDVTYSVFDADLRVSTLRPLVPLLNDFMRALPRDPQKSEEKGNPHGQTK